MGLVGAWLQLSCKLLLHWAAPAGRGPCRGHLHRIGPSMRCTADAGRSTRAKVAVLGRLRSTTLPAAMTPCHRPLRMQAHQVLQAPPQRTSTSNDGLAGAPSSAPIAAGGATSSERVEAGDALGSGGSDPASLRSLDALPSKRSFVQRDNHLPVEALQRQRLYRGSRGHAVTAMLYVPPMHPAPPGSMGRMWYYVSKPFSGALFVHDLSNQVLLLLPLVVGAAAAPTTSSLARAACRHQAGRLVLLLLRQAGKAQPLLQWWQGQGGVGVRGSSMSGVCTASGAVQHWAAAAASTSLRLRGPGVLFGNAPCSRCFEHPFQVSLEVKAAKADNVVTVIHLDPVSGWLWTGHKKGYIRCGGRCWCAGLRQRSGGREWVGAKAMVVVGGSWWGEGESRRMGIGRRKG